MSNDLSNVGEGQQKNPISLAQASKIFNLSAGHLNLLARSGKIKAVKLGRNWYTYEDSIRKYLSPQQETDENLIPLFKASKIFNLSAGHLNLLARSGKIKAVKLGRNWYTYGNSVRLYLEEHRKKVPEESQKNEIAIQLPEVPIQNEPEIKKEDWQTENGERHFSGVSKINLAQLFILIAILVALVVFGLSQTRIFASLDQKFSDLSLQFTHYQDSTLSAIKGLSQNFSQNFQNLEKYQKAILSEFVAFKEGPNLGQTTITSKNKPQLTVGYDDLHHMDISVSPSGVVNLDAQGGAGEFVFLADTRFTEDVTAPNIVYSVLGTSNRVTSSGGQNPQIDISPSYLGQTSINTLGTVSTGAWQATPLTTPYIGDEAVSEAKLDVNNIPSNNFYLRWNNIAGKMEWADVSVGSGAPIDSAYVTIGNDPNLTAERSLTGTSNQIILSDGGVNGNITLSAPQDIHTGASPNFAGLNIGNSGTVMIGAGNSVDGDVLLKFNTDRAWQFEVDGEGASTDLVLRTLLDSKNLVIKSADDTAAFTFNLINAGSIFNTENIQPNTDSTFNLGSGTAGKYYANAYIDTLYLNSTAYIEGTTSAGVIQASATAIKLNNSAANFWFVDTATHTFKMGISGAGGFQFQSVDNVTPRSFYIVSSGGVAKGIVEFETGAATFQGGLTLGANGASGVVASLIIKDGADPGTSKTLTYPELANMDGLDQTLSTTSSPTFAGVTLAGNIILDNGASRTIGPNTVDGTDNRYISIRGGGGAGATRGAQIDVTGNEFTSANYQGALMLYGGNPGTTGTYDGMVVFAPVATVAGAFNRTGDLGLVATKKLYLDGAIGTGDSYIVESSADVMDFYRGGVNGLKLAASTVVTAATNFLVDTPYQYVRNATNPMFAVVMNDANQRQIRMGVDTTNSKLYLTSTYSDTGPFPLEIRMINTAQISLPTTGGVNIGTATTASSAGQLGLNRLYLNSTAYLDGGTAGNIITNAAIAFNDTNVSLTEWGTNNLGFAAIFENSDNTKYFQIGHNGTDGYLYISSGILTLNSGLKIGTQLDATTYYLQVDTLNTDTAGPPASADCDASSEVGRTTVSTRYTATAEYRIWVCTQTGASTYGWKYAALN